MHVKPKKYPPANNPKFPAVRLNSDVRIGESVAIIDLNKLDIKNANAKTRNIKTLLFVLLIVSFLQLLLGYRYLQYLNH